MTRAMLLMFAILLPGTVLAEEETAAAPVAVEASAAEQAPSPQSSAPPPRRRPSMVGYIDDAQVQSHVRLRIDSAFHNDLPDRAEFFYAKCGCYQGLAQIIPQAFDPNAPGPGPAVPVSLNFQQLYLDAEYMAVNRVSVFAEIPARWIQPQSFQPIPPFAPFSNQGGLSDIRAGVKAALVSSDTRTLTFQLRGYFSSGSESKGLGTGHTSIEPTLLYAQQIGRFAVESEVGDWHPTSGSAGVPTAGSDKFSGDVVFYGVGPSYEMYRGDTIAFAPVVELVGWNVRGGFATLPGGPLLGAAAAAKGTNIVNLKIGSRIMMRDRSSVYVGWGHALTDAAWYQNIVRVEYRYAF